MTAPSPEAREQSLPRSTVDALTACLREGVGRLQHNSYEIRFEVEQGDDGGVERVRPTGDRLDDAGIEGCMVDALRDIPSDFMPTPSPISRSYPGHARGVLGNVGALPQWIQLAPVLVTASGVTVIVVVAVLVVAAAATLPRQPTKEECDAEWEWARNYCKKLFSKPNPPRALTGGYDNEEDCARGHVMEPCRGNEVDWGKQGRPGRRY